MKALFFLIPKNFRDEEFLVPKKKLEDAGVEVVVAGIREGLAVGMLGARLEPDVLIDEVDINEFDAVVVPGGSGAREYLWENEKVLLMISQAYNSGKVVAAICISGAVLANAGILSGRKATVYESEDTLRVYREKNVDYVPEDVVRDGLIITANGPGAAEKFAEKILEALKA